MTPFFSTPERIVALLAEAQSWVDTPFREGSCVKGARGGVDCIRLVEHLEHTSGATPKFTLPRGPVERTSLNAPSPLLAWLEGRIADPQSAALSRIFRHVALDAPVQAGDLVHFPAGRFWHLCVALGPRDVLTCLRPIGVQVNRLDDPIYAKRRDAVLRPYEEVND